MRIPTWERVCCTRTHGQPGAQPTALVCSPCPNGKRGPFRRAAAAAWSIACGHEKESRPVAGALPKSTSATPSPSVPGSHATRMAATRERSGGGRRSGRPATSSSTTAHPASARATAARTSAGGSRSSSTSPNPSAYGASPVTTTATGREAAPAEGACRPAAPALKSLAPGWTARMASAMVVPVVKALPSQPCHSSDQPPHWRPRLSAAMPVTSSSAAGRPASPVDSGRSPPSLTSSTQDLATARLAAARCASQPTQAASPIGGTAASKSGQREAAAAASPPAGVEAAARRSRPQATLTRSTRLTASSTRSAGTSPRPTAASSSSSCLRHVRSPKRPPAVMTMSTPALTTLQTAAEYESPHCCTAL
mmetsp:Transcript_49442/g.160232  ORF Transcript_49442/g.160232 Transcript_49442/m.160232 type:complete len:366 (+) Transcript_49442:122-1219(+)